MATVYDFLNPDSTEVEEQRIIRAPGATTGDVLTVQADKTVSPAPGGGGSGLVKLGPYPVTAAALAPVWGQDLGEAGVLELATLTEGTYVITWWPEVHEAFDTGLTGALYVGPALDDGLNPQTQPMDNVDSAGSYLRTPQLQGGVLQPYPARVLADAPLWVVASLAQPEPPATGIADIYLLVATT